MPTFGSYEPISELYLSGLGVVYTARSTAPGAPEQPVIVKTCQPDPAIIGEQEALRAIAAFIGQAQVMQAASKVASGVWAPVHEFGRFQDGTVSGAYYVTDLAQGGSLAKLAAGRVRLDSGTLSGLIEAIVQGLRALRVSAGRAHGNLKPTNVLLPGRGSEATSRVWLADPLPPAQADPARDDPADARALGEIIHLLVTHATGGTRGVWPVPASPSWSTLGSTGTQWRELTNQLLDPAPSGTFNLEELGARVRALRGSGGRMGGSGGGGAARRPLVAAGLAGVLALIGGGAWLLTRSGSPAKPNTGTTTGGTAGTGTGQTSDKWDAEAQARWVELCTAYRSWSRDFARDLDARPPALPQGLGLTPPATRREFYAALDPALGTALAPFSSTSGSEPWAIAGVSADTDPVTLSQSPSPKAMTPEGVAKTRAALDGVRSLAQALGEGWATGKGLRERAAAFESLAWTPAAQYLRALVDGVKPGQSTALTASIDAAVIARTRAERIDERWAAALARAGAIAASGDAVLAKLPAWAPGFVASSLAAGENAPDQITSDPLERLARTVDTLTDLTTRLETFVKTDKDSYDLTSFAASPAYATLAAGTPAAETFENWLFEVKAFPSIDPTLDPRRLWNVPQLVEQIRVQARSLAGPPLSTPVDATTAATIDRLADQAQALDPRSLAWSRANQARIIEEAPRLRKALEDLGVDLGGRIDRRRSDLGASTAEVQSRLKERAQIVAGSASVNKAWREWRDALLASSADASMDELRERSGRLEELLKEGDRAMKPAPPISAGAPAWSVQLSEAVLAERERRLAAALSALGQAPPATPDAERAVREALRDAGSQFERWLAGVEGVQRDLTLVSGALEKGAAPTDPIPGDPDGRSIAGVLDALGRDALSSDSIVSRAIKALRDRIGEIERLGTERDVGALVKTVLSAGRGQADQALAAWRRLCSPDLNWPSTPAQLDEASRARKAIIRIAASLEDPAKKAQVTKQLEADFPERWRVFASRASDAQSIDAAFDLRPEFGVENKDLEPRMVFNLILRNLRSDLKPTDSDDAVKDKVRQLQQATRNASFSADPRVLKIAEALASAMDARGTSPPPPPPSSEADPTTSGPARAGFTGSIEAGGIVTFRRAQTTLQFAKLDTPGPAVYLSTTELSTGQFIDIVSAFAAWPTIKQQIPPGDSNSWRGARAWIYDQRGVMALARPGWLFPDSNIDAANPAFPPEFKGSGPFSLADAAGGDPSRDHPIDKIPPSTAKAVARLAGCRLPSVEEFKAAITQFAGGGSNLQSFNLRDQTFSTQKSHIVRMRANPKLTLKAAYTFPDEEIFVASGTNPPQGEDATSHPWSDGILFFEKVTTGPGTIKHLIGNVAEFAAADTTGAATTSVSVIGGSALSPPDVPVDAPLTPDASEGEIGYADVGFRLAFTPSGAGPAPATPAQETLASRLVKALAGVSYLPAKER